MKFSELLHTPSGWSPAALPDLKSLKSATERVRARWPNIVAEPPETDRERIVQDVRHRLRAWNWGDCRISLVCMAARATFDKERRARADLQELRNFYYGEIAISDSSTFLNALLETYIESYEPQADHTVALAQALRGNRARLSARDERLLSHFSECLDPRRAAAALAKKMTVMGDCWRELREMGIWAPHAPGLMQHAHLAFVQLLKPQLASVDSVKQLFAWLRPEGQRPLQMGAAAAIEAVLSPWRNSEPAPELRDLLLRELTDCYGDARVSRGGVWSGVPEELLEKTIYPWLTGQNIWFFLDVVSEVEMRDAKTRHMWPPRRRFWEDLHRQKRVDAAWVAFSPAAQRRAHQIATERGNKSLLHFGAQIAGGSRGDTSLLILRVGSRIIIEGSHNYKVHIFTFGDKNAPRLFETRYDCERIRLSLEENFKRTHNSGWQNWVTERI